MRNLIIALLIFSLTGCKDEYIDKRPAEQSAFVRIAREWRDTVNAPVNQETLRLQLLEKGVNTLKSHIVDSLGLQFQSWEARVLDVGTDPSDAEYTITSFGMNLDEGVPDEKTRYQSLVLTSRTSKSDPAYTAIKSLKTGDLLRISGSFAMLLKTINIDSYNDLSKSKNVLDNPEFRVDVGKVERF